MTEFGIFLGKDGVVPTPFIVPDSHGRPSMTWPCGCKITFNTANMLTGNLTDRQAVMIHDATQIPCPLHGKENSA